MFYSHLKGHIEALLFASGEPISSSRLSEILNVEQQHIALLVAQINDDLSDDHRGLIIVEVAGGYQLCTKPELAAVVEKLAYVRETRLSSASMETIAIIAFKQPITRQEIENIRGVKVDKVMSTLIEHGLVKELGRRDTIGRPILYGTTDEFLNFFGLKTLDDLPRIDGFLLEQP